MCTHARTHSNQALRTIGPHTRTHMHIHPTHDAIVSEVMRKHITPTAFDYAAAATGTVFVYVATSRVCLYGLHTLLLCLMVVWV